MMDTEKVKEKAKHGDRQSYFSAAVAMKFIVLAFALLTLIRSYISLDALPVFNWGYEVFGMLLTALPAFVFLARFLRESHIIPLVLIFIGLLILCLPILFIGFIASWIFAAWIYFPLKDLPVLIFPLLFIASLILYQFSEQVSKKLSLSGLRLISVCILWFAAFYIWGYGGWLDGRHYDEGLTFSNHSYHIIIHPGFLGDPGTFEFYECQTRRIFCTMVYESEAGWDEADKVSLTWANHILYLKYEGLIILEHPFS